MSLSRETLKWVLSLDLSYPVKNVRRDFANGFLFAEVLSRYYPAEVQLHSFENVASTERKKANWRLLDKLFKKRNIPVDKAQIEGVMAADGDAAVELLQQLHAFIHSPAYEASQGSTGHLEDEQATSWPTRPAAEPAYAPYYSPGDHQDMYGEQPMFIPSHPGSGVPPMQQGYVQTGAYGAMQGAPGACLQPPGSCPQQQQGGVMPPQWQVQAPAQGYVGMGHAVGGHQGAQQGAWGAAYSPLPAYTQHPSPGQPLAQASAASSKASPSVKGAAVSKKAANQRQGNKASSSSPPQPNYAQPALEQQYGQHFQQDAWTHPQLHMQQQPPQQQWPMQAYAPGMAVADQHTGMPIQGMPAGYDYESYAAGLQPGASSAPAQPDNIPFSKSRPVDYQPYDMKDYEDKAYNVKRQGAGYWQLGRLGPDLETPELQAKREKAERLKAMAAQVREDNMKKAAVAAVKPRKEPVKEPSARDRAMQFAKQVPKPEPAPKATDGGGPAAGKLGSGRGSEKGGPGRGSVPQSPPNQLQLLEAQHAEDQRKVDAIRAQLARVL